ncbi:hypothetical protein V8C42DRAFT_318860 [Trichoderma barbatum]
MSPATRRGQCAHNRTTSPSSHKKDKLEEATEAFCSLTISGCEPHHLDGVWQNLRRLYEAEKTRSDQSFPDWALTNLPLEQMKALIRVAYCKDLGALDHYAAPISSHFKIEPWKFILFFNYIEQGRARILNKVSKARPSLTFQQLYEDVQCNRSNRLKGRKNPTQNQKKPRAEFQPSDFRACLQGSDDGEFDKCDDESEDESQHEGNNTIRQEPYFRPVDEHNGRSHQGRNDTITVSRPIDEHTSISHQRGNCIGDNDVLTITVRGSHRADNHFEDEERRQDLNQGQTSPWNPHTFLRKFVTTQQQEVQDSKQQLHYQQQQHQYKQERLQKGESLLTELDELQKEDTASIQSIKDMEEENKYVCQELWWQSLWSKKTTHLEENRSLSTPAVSAVTELKRRRQIEEEKLEGNEIKRARIVADSQKLMATSANTASSLPIPSMEAS